MNGFCFPFPHLVDTETSKPQITEVHSVSQLGSRPSFRFHLIQSKHRKLIIKVSIISSHNFHSQVTKHESGYWCPQNIGRFFSVLIHELVQKLHDFLFYLTDTTLMQDLAVKTKWPMMRKEWTPCCAFHWMQFSNNNNNNNIDSLILSAFLSSMRLFFFSASSSQLLSPPAVRSCHNLQDESTTWLLKETETKSQFNYSKKFKQTRKVHMKQKKQKKSSSKSGDQSMNN